MNAAPLPLQLLVIAKSPVPGQVKTRLSPVYSPAEAARLAEAALRDTLAAVTSTRVERHVVACDGAPGEWLPAEVDVIEQRGDGLDERIAAALADAWASTPLPVLLIGMDTPHVTPTLLEQCARTLLTDGTDAVLGLASDGGFWALGIRRPHPDLVTGVPMSVPETGAAQLERLQSAGLRVALLATLRDVDTADDAAAVAAAAPTSGFASTVTRLVAARGGAT